MIRADMLTWRDYDGYTKMTAPSSNVYSADEDESKHIIVHENLSRNCSTDESESKRNVVHKNLSQKYSTDESESKWSIVNKTL